MRRWLLRMGLMASWIFLFVANAYTETGEWPSPVCIHQASPENIKWMPGSLGNDDILSGAVNVQGEGVQGGIRLEPGREGVEEIELLIQPGRSSVQLRFGQQKASALFQNKHRYLIDLQLIQGLLIIQVDGRRLFEDLRIPVATQGVRAAFIASFESQAVGVVCFESWEKATTPVQMAPFRMVE